jgi:hypothetical protein
LSVRRTDTGYWVVQRGSVTLAGGVTKAAAEAERDLAERLRDRGRRRGGDFRTRAARTRRR